MAGLRRRRRSIKQSLLRRAVHKMSRMEQISVERTALFGVPQTRSSAQAKSITVLSSFDRGSRLVHTNQRSPSNNSASSCEPRRVQRRSTRNQKQIDGSQLWLQRVLARKPFGTCRQRSLAGSSSRCCSTKDNRSGDSLKGVGTGRGSRASSLSYPSSWNLDMPRQEEIDESNANELCPSEVTNCDRLNRTAYDQRLSSPLSQRRPKVDSCVQCRMPHTRTQSKPPTAMHKVLGNRCGQRVNSGMSSNTNSQCRPKSSPTSSLVGNATRKGKVTGNYGGYTASECSCDLNDNVSDKRSLGRSPERLNRIEKISQPPRGANAISSQDNECQCESDLASDSEVPCVNVSCPNLQQTNGFAAGNGRARNAPESPCNNPNCRNALTQTAPRKQDENYPKSPKGPSPNSKIQSGLGSKRNQPEVKCNCKCPACIRRGSPAPEQTNKSIKGAAASPASGKGSASCRCPGYVRQSTDARSASKGRQESPPTSRTNKAKTTTGLSKKTPATAKSKQKEDGLRKKLTSSCKCAHCAKDVFKQLAGSSGPGGGNPFLQNDNRLPVCIANSCQTSSCARSPNGAVGPRGRTLGNNPQPYSTPLSCVPHCDRECNRAVQQTSTTGLGRGRASWDANRNGRNGQNGVQYARSSELFVIDPPNGPNDKSEMKCGCTCPNCGYDINSVNRSAQDQNYSRLGPGSKSTFASTSQSPIGPPTQRNGTGSTKSLSGYSTKYKPTEGNVQPVNECECCDIIMSRKKRKSLDSVRNNNQKQQGREADEPASLTKMGSTSAKAQKGDALDDNCNVKQIIQILQETVTQLVGQCRCGGQSSTSNTAGASRQENGPTQDTNSQLVECFCEPQSQPEVNTARGRNSATNETNQPNQFKSSRQCECTPENDPWPVANPSSYAEGAYMANSMGAYGQQQQPGCISCCLDRHNKGNGQQLYQNQGNNFYSQQPSALMEDNRRSNLKISPQFCTTQTCPAKKTSVRILTQTDYDYPKPPPNRGNYLANPESINRPMSPIKGQAIDECPCCPPENGNQQQRSVSPNAPMRPKPPTKEQQTDECPCYQQDDKTQERRVCPNAAKLAAYRPTQETDDYSSYPPENISQQRSIYPNVNTDTFRPTPCPPESSPRQQRSAYANAANSPGFRPKSTSPGAQDIDECCCDAPEPAGFRSRSGGCYPFSDDPDPSCADEKLKMLEQLNATKSFMDIFEMALALKEKSDLRTGKQKFVSFPKPSSCGKHKLERLTRDDNSSACFLQERDMAERTNSFPLQSEEQTTREELTRRSPKLSRRQGQGYQQRNAVKAQGRLKEILHREKATQKFPTLNCGCCQCGFSGESSHPQREQHQAEDLRRKYVEQELASSDSEYYRPRTRVRPIQTSKERECSGSEHMKVWKNIHGFFHFNERPGKNSQESMEVKRCKKTENKFVAESVSIIKPGKRYIQKLPSEISNSWCRQERQKQNSEPLQSRKEDFSKPVECNSSTSMDFLPCRRKPNLDLNSILQAKKDPKVSKSRSSLVKEKINSGKEDENYSKLAKPKLKSRIENREVPAEKAKTKIILDLNTKQKVEFDQSKLRKSKSIKSLYPETRQKRERKQKRELEIVEPKKAKSKSSLQAEETKEGKGLHHFELQQDILTQCNRRRIDKVNEATHPKEIKRQSSKSNGQIKKRKESPETKIIEETQREPKIKPKTSGQLDAQTKNHRAKRENKTNPPIPPEKPKKTIKSKSSVSFCIMRHKEHHGMGLKQVECDDVKVLYDSSYKFCKYSYGNGDTNTDCECASELMVKKHETLEVQPSEGPNNFFCMLDARDKFTECRRYLL